MKNETPRTNVALLKCVAGEVEHSGVAAMADFARQLERELASAISDCAEMHVAHNQQVFKFQQERDRSGSVILQLLTAASLMRLTIKERATFLTRTTDWERLEDAMRNTERELKQLTDISKI